MTDSNPEPGGPGGASAPGEPLQGSGEQLLDAGATGTDEGPAGIPASLAGRDRDGDEVGSPPAARPGGDERGASADTTPPQSASEGRTGETGRALPDLTVRTYGL